MSGLPFLKQDSLLDIVNPIISELSKLHLINTLVLVSQYINTDSANVQSKNVQLLNAQPFMVALVKKHHSKVQLSKVFALM